ncbi:MAG: hypothetical protein QXI36_07440, partial [Candidatus Bathyarchaeia archaeon]
KESWNDKFIIWVNFPETILHRGVKVVERYTIKLLEEIAPGDGVVIGMTEDAPVDLLEDAFTTITKTLTTYGRYPVKSNIF